MTDAAHYDDDGEPTGRTNAIREAGARGDVRALAGEVATMRKSVSTLVTIEERRRGALWAVGVIGSVAVTIALGMGTRALALASDAAVDHDRLGRVIVDVDTAHERLDAQARALATVERDAAAQTATQVALARAVGDLTTEVRELRRELAERDRRR